MVARVEVLLTDGSRRRAIPRDGWFVFTQDDGRAKPVPLIGLDGRSRVAARADGRLF
jgi:hypothetical protein